ncbi:MAG: hypothetical protein ACI4QL_01620 [Candidatus Fimimonas sp.]
MKKLSKLSITLIILSAITLVLLFVPMRVTVYPDNNSVAESAFTWLTYIISIQYVAWWQLPTVVYPIVAALFAVIIVIKSIRNIKLAKTENPVLPKVAHTRCLFILLIFAIWGFGINFFNFGFGEGDWGAIGMAVVVYLLPVILLMVFNSQCKKLYKKLKAELSK